MRPDEAGTADVPVVAIDGPSGAGKGTVSRALAGRLGWHLLDSGALYRVVALAALRAGIPLDDAAAVAGVAGSIHVEFLGEADAEQVRLGGEDVSGALRTERCGEAASQIAAISQVRQALLARQRAFAAPPGLVADGRDMGTVVFPDARLKVFLTASAEERAIRRYKQLKKQGIDVSLRGLSREIAQRDKRDADRPVAPLLPAKDARIIDSTDMSPEDVVKRILQWLREAGVMAG